jgi:cell division protein FtsN
VSKSPQKPKAKPAATRHNTGQNTHNMPLTLTKAHLHGAMAGALVGVMATLSMSHWLAQPDPTKVTATIPAPITVVEPAPRFVFDTVLPNEEVDLTPDIEPAELTAGDTDTPDYLLQVGSFRQEEDADRRRGELALLGLEASVELTNGDNGRWYRVTMGPFANRSEIARARSMAAQANMDTLLLRRESQ